MVAKFRKKPVVIEAVQWTGDNFDEIEAFVTGRSVRKDLPDMLRISTLEGWHIASKGDWIIKGVAGECYPCKPEIFAKTYEPVVD